MHMNAYAAGPKPTFESILTHRIPLLLLLALFLSAGQIAAASDVRRIGDIEVRISKKNGSNNSNVIGFSAIERSANSAGPTNFRNSGVITAEFHGSCSELVRVEVKIIGNPSSLDQFINTGAGRDLPIHNLLRITQQSLFEECQDLQVIRINMQSAITRDKYKYEGTMMRSNGWSLEDGHVATTFDAGAPVNVASRDIGGRVQVRHSGTCEVEPIIVLEPSRPQTDNRDVRLMTDYQSYASGVSQTYAEQCPAVKNIRFALGLMPKDYFCKQSGDCFIEANRIDGKWKANINQFNTSLYENPITSFEDMAEVLAAGKFEVLKKYQDFFSFFVWSYFQSYSSVCRSNIQRPTSRITRYTDTKRDSSGNIISEEVKESDPVLVESAHAWAYDMHEGGARTYALRGAMSAVESTTNIKSGMAASIRIGQVAIGRMNEMSNLLGGKCTEDRIITIQQNMLNYASNKAPITGKYNTDKKPITEHRQSMYSAPDFMEQYQKRGARSSTEASSTPSPKNEAENSSAKTGASDQKGKPLANEGAAGGSSMSSTQGVFAVHQKYLEAMRNLRTEHQQKIKGTTPSQRKELESEFKSNQSTLQQEYQEAIRKATGR